ncbi:tRNA m7G46 methyltransferase [Campylobacter blaseri]|uniref:tRNA (guanine-N(7)-)-methyltransferase n=1 Tax=Campylobacter blaseri TaxID=2042961 RepID=A0A2P8R046_9BACT|nr:tRNA (guanosine(46)-N7)-methyltransferase TrmB [Campylobacter blaseri]PSM51852.1 tRNA (guanosine(46)-N7)-methyltransferase TrmB [Campylobacter blaseri]PSM53643.1 tRNA (guanosine(46)-N7)-methyltransferase TrmB [Campylobacter blaseri]QKF86458.1 tRNA m7G46 methyltransferase [Campylobacter blaseri]
MPNFTTRKVKVLSLPFKKDDIEILQIAKGRMLDLVLVKVGDEEFFLTIKPTKDSFLIKGEKITRPSKVGLLQKALELFSVEFCEEILSSAFGYNKNSLIENNSIIKSEKELLEIINGNKKSKICIEIGFGSGRHILYRAKENKDTIFIGIEIYKPAIEQVAKLALKEELNNIYLIDNDARIFLNLIDSNKIEKIYLHFPIPWNDAPHRRVISEEFLMDVQRVLKKDGSFELRSDSREYVDFSILKFLDRNGVEVEIFKNKDLEISSKYEDRWKKQQKDIYDIFVKNKVESLSLKNEYNMDFDTYSPKKIINSFENITKKFDDFFIHIEDMYKFNDNDIVIKFSFGGFNTPENGFIRISKNSAEYFIKKPLMTKRNYKAHCELREILAKWNK